MNKTTIRRLIAFVLVVSVYLILKFKFNFFETYTKEDVQKDKTKMYEHGVLSHEAKYKDSVFNVHRLSGFQDTIVDLENTIPDSIIDACINLVLKESKVQELNKNIKKMPAEYEARMAFQCIILNESEQIYHVKVCNNNTYRLETIFNYLVDAKSMKILNKDGAINDDFIKY